VRDVMENGKDGLLVQPTASSLLEALRTMLQNPEGSKTMGNRFKEKILRDHTWEVQSAAILESATAERFL
jgi:glycosyltransferase involved in cell wall biosynthesis